MAFLMQKCFPTGELELPFGAKRQDCGSFSSLPLFCPPHHPSYVSYTARFRPASEVGGDRVRTFFDTNAPYSAGEPEVSLESRTV